MIYPSEFFNEVVDTSQYADFLEERGAHSYHQKSLTSDIAKCWDVKCTGLQ